MGFTITTSITDKTKPWTLLMDKKRTRDKMQSNCKAQSQNNHKTSSMQALKTWQIKEYFDWLTIVVQRISSLQDPRELQWRSLLPICGSSGQPTLCLCREKKCQLINVTPK